MIYLIIVFFDVFTLLKNNCFYGMQFSRYDIGSFIFSGSSGDKGIRTLDPLLARQVLSQLSYTPI